MKIRYLWLLLVLSTVSFSQEIGKKTTKKSATNEKIKVTESIVNTSMDAEIHTEVPVQAVSTYDNDENTIYNSAGVEVAAEFPGGNEKLGLFLSKNILFTNEMKSAAVKGKVFASFVVERDGRITNLKIIREIGYETGKEILRVLKTMPNWQPAELNGKKVRCSYALPINIDATKQ